MSTLAAEHDYIGLSNLPVPPPSHMETKDKANETVLNLKATELRLGLPGSESPTRDDEEDDDPGGFLSLKSCNYAAVSGAKRVFSDAINNGSGKWVFSTSGSSNGVSGSGKGGAVVKEGKEGNGSHVAKAVEPVTGEKKGHGSAPASKAQVVGWPPIRSFRKNTMASSHSQKSDDDSEAKSGSGKSCLYVKVSMDGAPYLRKIGLKTYKSYVELSSALEKMFSCFTIGQFGSHGIAGRDGLNESRLSDLLHGSEYVLTYEDKDGDWMLVGDVPWKMFTDTCRRLRIMKSSEAIGLAPRAMEKCRSRN